MHVCVYVFSSTRVSFFLIFCLFTLFANAFNIKFKAILSCSLPSTRHFGISINKLDCLYLCVFLFHKRGLYFYSLRVWTIIDTASPSTRFIQHKPSPSLSLSTRSLFYFLFLSPCHFEIF